jgi:hypothetical protein
VRVEESVSKGYHGGSYGMLSLESKVTELEATTPSRRLEQLARLVLKEGQS